uniref:Putative nadh dehydrogenase ubiquinone 1 beta subcomplex subunit 2 mitochondrial n=1 Tax=Tabanus bromius TaxID=304241 RepID=A0A0K8TQ77_TABBR
MLSSRGLLLGRALKQLISSKSTALPSKLLIRNSHAVSYRVAAPPASKATKFGAEFVGALMWWWVLWHLWHEYEHITGEFEYPDPSKWTNAELGIPPDDYEE